MWDWTVLSRRATRSAATAGGCGGTGIAESPRMSKPTLAADRPPLQRPSLLMLSLLVGVAAAGCESSPSNARPSPGTGGSEQGAGSTGGTGSGSGGAEGGSGGAGGSAQVPMNICQTTVDEFCGAATPGRACPRSWPGDDLLTTCPGLTYGRVFTVDCGAYLVLIDSGVDTVVRYYYEPTTRQLTAIIFDYGSGTATTAIGPSCLAGPIGADANSFPESCPALSDLLTCPR